MKVRELLDVAADDEWSVIAEPDGRHCCVFVADYVGGHKETMEILNPLLDREVMSFSAEVVDDPEPEGSEAAEKVPAVWIDLQKERLNGDAETLEKEEPMKEEKAYAVEISETRVIRVLVEAENESDAYDRAESLHESSDEICGMLNDPMSNRDTDIRVYAPVEPKEDEHVW